MEGRRCIVNDSFYVSMLGLCSINAEYFSVRSDSVPLSPLPSSFGVRVESQRLMVECCIYSFARSFQCLGTEDLKH